MNASGTGKKVANANQNIQVYLRVRPTNARERGIKSLEVVEVPNHREVIARQLIDTKTTKKFTFDRAFGPDSKQNEVYSTVVAPLIDEVLAGYNCTVFAYGQTGTGKTFTMVGEEAPELGLSWEDDGPIGICPRALSHLFDELRAMDMEFSMRVSYLELYNEELCDLLSTDDTVKIRIFDDSTKKGSVIVQGLEEIPVHNKDDVYKLLAKGQERRRTASTLMNAQSSRSHTVFSILVHIRENGMDGEEMLKIGKLNLVDLAGSENISKAGNEKGIRTRETVNINQSLLTLGRVITALVEKTPHIPYRESKLTRLLQESLGGRTKTSIIATISPGHKDLEETLSTLDYAHRAKNIQNRPEINQRLTKKTVLKEYTEEIDKLKRDLMAARDKNGIYLAQETYEDMVFKIESSNKELTDKQDKIKALKEELAKQTKLFDEISYNLIERTQELAVTDARLKVTEANLDLKRKNLRKAKKKYEEKKAVLHQHMKTEETLTQQARELISTAEAASKDTEKLHDSIARHKAVETEVQTSCETFTQRIQGDLTHANETLAKFQENFDAKSNEIQAGVKEFSHENAALIETLRKLLRAAEKIETERTETVAAEIQKTEGVFRENVKCIIDDTKKFQKTVTSTSEKMQNNFQDIVLTGFEALTAQIGKISETQKQIIHSIRVRDEEFQQSTSVLTEKIASISARAAEIDGEFEKLTECHKIFFDYTSRMGSHLAALQNSNKNIENSAQTATNELKTLKTSKFMANQESFNSTMATLVTEIQAEAEEHSKALVLEVNNIRECVVEHVDAYVTAHANSLGTIVSKNLMENHAKLGEAHAAFSDALKVKTTDMGSVVEKVETTTNAHATSTETRVHNTTELTKSFTNNLKGQFRKTSDGTERFRQDEITEYAPTGETPARKEYKIDHDLAQTLPHERIVRRFRLEGNVDLDSSTFSECDEDCSMLNESSVDNPICVVNSTPFKDGVTERKNLSDPHMSQILGLSAIVEEDKENVGTTH